MGFSYDSTQRLSAISTSSGYASLTGTISRLAATQSTSISPKGTTSTVTNSATRDIYGRITSLSNTAGSSSLRWNRDRLMARGKQFAGKQFATQMVGKILTCHGFVQRCYHARVKTFPLSKLSGRGVPCGFEDGTVVRRGLSEKARERLTTPDERRLVLEVLTRRVQHFSKGVLLGSRAFIDGWFSGHRDIVKGRSRTERQQGARSLGRPALRGLYALRNPQA